MSQLWVDIERLVLDGVGLDPSKGSRLAAMTQTALERLLRERGISTGLQGGDGAHEREKRSYGAEMKSQPGPDEARWAEELAEVLYRAIDRMA
jgi:hypothetical protein